MASRTRAKVEAAIKKGPPTLRDFRWWAKEDPHLAVWDNFKRIGGRTSGERSRASYYAALYDDDGYYAAMNGTAAIGEFTPQTMSTNVIRRQVDTYVAKVTKNRPVPMGLTTGGNYGQQRRAKAISKLFEGLLDETKFWATRTLRQRDAGVVGCGLALNYRVGRKMFHDHLFKREVRVCPIDAERGNPRTMYIGRLIDKLVLAERFPEHAEEIYTANADAGDGSVRSAYEEDSAHLALVIEGWHLRSGENAADGKHIICINNATLALGDYIRDTFPVSKFDFSPPQSGYFGTGLAQQLDGLQFEINAVGMRLQERHYLMGTYITRRADCPVTYETIDNGTLTEVVWEGEEPKFVTPPASHPDLFNWWESLRTKMPAEITGLSNFATRSEKPAGIIAAKAVRMVSDSDLENLTPQGRGDEQDVIDTCWQYFDLAEEIHAETGKEPERASKNGHKTEGNGPYVVQVEMRKHGRDELQDMDYAKVRLDRKQFKLRVFPTNFLRGTPEEQMQSVNEMIDAGFLSQDEALVLLDFPDLQRVMNLRGAARHVIERILENILEASDPTAEGVYVYPEPPMNLKLCRALGTMTYLEAKLDGAPDKNLKMVMRFILDSIAEDAKEESKNAATMPSGAQLPPGEQPPVDADPTQALGGPMPDETYAPPAGGAPMPAGAVAPTVMPGLPGGM